MKFFYFVFLLHFIGFSTHAQVNNTYNLMPFPLELHATDQKVIINEEFRISVIGKPAQRLFSEANRFIRRLSDKTGIFFDKKGFVTSKDTSRSSALLINVKRPGKLVIEENEQYQIDTKDGQIVISAETDLGAIRALETLLQLISTDNQGYYFPGVKINDKPRFIWRGLLLDVALHFMPIEVVKRTLDGMAAVKMNVLHLHLCNDQGFRVESKKFPRLNLLGSEGQYYTQENIKEIVRYADQRGIRIVPEFVVPAHTTAILVAFPELASIKRKYSLQRYFGVFDPVLDPTNPKVYSFIDTLFTEMAGLFPDKYFHIGGDENTGKDWANSPHIKSFMKQKGLVTSLDLQTEFNKKILPILKKNGKTMMGWDEIYHPGISKEIVIQSWRGNESFYSSVMNGYKSILSYGYYIDLIQPTDYHYLNDPIPDEIKLKEEQTKNVLGGEATMWSEHVTPQTVDSRIWPRTAAIAERLWSDKNIKNIDSMYSRLEIISLQLELLGLKHLSFKSELLRRLSNSEDTKVLETLVNVIEPLKIYERNQGDTMYTIFSPYTKIADLATPDQKLPRVFLGKVNGFLKSRSNVLEKEIEEQLKIWKENHVEFLKLILNSPTLKEAENLSNNLSILSERGLQAIDYLNKKTVVDEKWINESLLKIEKAKEQGGRCELQIVYPIELLVKAVSHN